MSTIIFKYNVKPRTIERLEMDFVHGQFGYWVETLPIDADSEYAILSGKTMEAIFHQLKERLAGSVPCERVFRRKTNENFIH